MPMTIAFIAHNPLGQWWVFCIFLLEVSFVILGGWEFSFAKRLLIGLHLYKLSEVLCKICHLFFNIILIWGIIGSRIYGFESKWFARIVRGQSELISLKRANKLLDLDLIKIFAHLNGGDFNSEAFGRISRLSLQLLHLQFSLEDWVWQYLSH